ncbi:MAG: hypothetical protein K8S98_06310 [Planctomycetes bacterium]|nr:hypothetical protein [Planctomycetota bacterium]
MSAEKDFAASVDDAGTNAFRDRVQRALSHDLRTPLGTIANYATILEYHEQGKPDEVRVFGSRIRASAVRIGAMLEALTEALRLARAGSDTNDVDLAGLLRELLSSTGLSATYTEALARPVRRCKVDPALVSFTWRAFLELQSEAASHALLELGLAVEHDERGTAIDLWTGAPSEHTADPALAQAFARELQERPALEGCFALGLAEDLVRLRGGSLGLWGRPGAAARLRLTLPHAR